MKLRGWTSHLSANCAVSCDECSIDLCKLCASSSSHVCKTVNDLADEDDEDPSSSSDGEQADMVAQEAEECLEEEERTLVRGAGDGENAAFPAGGILVHKLWATAHKIRDAHTTACGIAAPALKYDYFFEGEDVPRAHLCWRPGCAPWTGDNLYTQDGCAADGGKEMFSPSAARAAAAVARASRLLK